MYSIPGQRQQVGSRCQHRHDFAPALFRRQGLALEVVLEQEAGEIMHALAFEGVGVRLCDGFERFLVCVEAARLLEVNLFLSDEHKSAQALGHKGTRKSTKSENATS